MVNQDQILYLFIHRLDFESKNILILLEFSKIFFKYHTIPWSYLRVVYLYGLLIQNTIKQVINNF